MTVRAEESQPGENHRKEEKRNELKPDPGQKNTDWIFSSIRDTGLKYWTA